MLIRKVDFFPPLIKEYVSSPGQLIRLILNSFCYGSYVCIKPDSLNCVNGNVQFCMQLSECIIPIKQATLFPRSVLLSLGNAVT